MRYCRCPEPDIAHGHYDCAGRYRCGTCNGGMPSERTRQCVECGDSTFLACSDCAIDSEGKRTVYVCAKASCRDAHEKKHPDVEHV